jgi:hypothetical protein
MTTDFTDKEGQIGQCSVNSDAFGHADSLLPESPSIHKPDFPKKRSGIAFSTGVVKDRKFAKKNDKVKRKMLKNSKERIQYVLLFDAPISNDLSIIRAFALYSICKSYQENSVILSKHQFINGVAKVINCSPQTLYRDMQVMKELGLIVKEATNRHQLVSWKKAGEIAAKVGKYENEYLDKSRYVISSENVRDEVITAYRLKPIKQNYNQQEYKAVTKATKIVEAKVSNQNFNARILAKYGKGKDLGAAIRRAYLNNELDKRTMIEIDNIVADISPLIGRAKIASLIDRKSATSATNLIRKAVKYGIVNDYIVLGDTFCFAEDIEEALIRRYRYVCLSQDTSEKKLGKGVMAFGGVFYERACNQILFNDTYEDCLNKSHTTDLYKSV